MTYDSYCSVCGLAIPTSQIGICIDEYTTVDFTTRSYCTLSIHICVECWEKMKTITDSGMAVAVERALSLQEMQQ